MGCANSEAAVYAVGDSPGLAQTYPGAILETAPHNSWPTQQQSCDVTAKEWDVIVVGGGNAGLVAALAAADSGAEVLLVERAPHHMRGGNTRHTRNIRCASGADVSTGDAYRRDELWADLCSVGDGPNDEALASLTVRESESMPGWMTAHGVRWQPALKGTLHLSRTNRFFLGGGKALINTYYREVAHRPAITVLYDTAATDLEIEDRTCAAVVLRTAGESRRVRARAVVCASGGFESNIAWLRQYWGAAADNYAVRGTPYNDGALLSCLYRVGAGRAGQEKGFHAIAVDSRSPRFDGGIATRLDSIPFGIVVNKAGERFYDEGEEIWPKRYAMWGRHIAEQPDQAAFSLWDSRAQGLFLPPMYPPYSADSIEGLAGQLGLDPGVLATTVRRYNDAVQRGGVFDPRVLDTCRTAGLTPPKSHWARRLDSAPYYAAPMRPGITFTYMGVAVDAEARVKRTDGSVFSNVYAAGEIMSGNILSNGYLAGFGLTIGSVWGRRAGTRAAQNVR